MLTDCPFCARLPRSSLQPSRNTLPPSSSSYALPVTPRARLSRSQLSELSPTTRRTAGLSLWTRRTSTLRPRAARRRSWCRSLQTFA